MQVRILGPLDVFDGERVVALGGPKERAVLAALAVQAGVAVSESALIHAVWGDDPPRTAERTLRSYISRLRRVFAGQSDVIVEKVGTSYRLRVSPGAIDVHQVENLVADSRRAAADGDPERASALLRLAEASWRGSSLGEFATQPFAEAEAARLEELRLAIVQERVAIDLGRGHHADAVVELEWLTSLHPLREQLWATRMVALYRCGRQAEALRVYQVLRQRLADDLGIDPSPDLRRLEEAILRQAPELDFTPTAQAHAEQASALPVPHAVAVVAELSEHAVPPLVRAAASGALLDREHELERLTCICRAATGARAVLLTGEAGIGKTRLATELAVRAAEEGAVILYGRAHEELPAPYQPVIDAVADHLASCTDAARAMVAAHASPELLRLLPAWGNAARAQGRPVTEDADLERAALFDSAAAVLSSCAGGAQLVVVLDDLQWAPPSTLLFLGHLLRSSRTPPMLVIATVRDTDLPPGHLLPNLAAGLASEGLLDQIPLYGLGDAAIADLTAQLAGADLDEGARSLATAVHAETGGNPFLAQTVVRHLVDTGVLAVSDGQGTATVTSLDGLELPALARDVVEHRVRRLSATAQAVLAAAALVEGPLHPALLEDVVSSARPDDVIDALDEAAAAGLLVDEAGAYAFAHGLVRRALVAGLSAARRARVHRRIGEAMEQLHANPATLAHHFLQAAPDGQAHKAARYALEAARAALARLANEEATGLVRRALAVLDAAPHGESLLRADLLLLLGQACERSNDIAGMREAVLRSAAEARAGGSPDRMAQAAVLLGTQGSVTTGRRDPAFAALCEDAMRILDDDALRVRLMAAYAVYLNIGEGNAERASLLATEAVAIARRLDECDVLADALVALAASTHEAASIADRLTLLDEALNLSDDTYVVVAARTLQLRLLLESGEIGALDRLIDELEAFGEQRRSWAAQTNAASYRSGRALFDGSFGEVPALADRILAHGRGDRDAQNVWAALITVMHRELGRMSELRPPIIEALDEQPGVVVYRAGAALLEAYEDRMDEAARHLAVLEADGFAAIPHDPTRPTVLTVLAEVVAILGAGEAAEVLYDLMLPLEGRFVDLAGSGACLGTTDRALGLLALTCGRVDQAEAHLRRALSMELTAGSPPLVARTRFWLARTLLARRAAGGRDEVEALLAAAAEAAEELGMSGLLAEIRLLERWPLPVALGPQTPFEGRDAELAELLVSWRHAQDGVDTGVLLAGEPGIGKTQLATELGRRVRATGGTVIRGRCDEHVSPPYQPFVEALRSLVGLVHAGELTAQLGSDAAEIARLVPELVDPGVAPEPGSDPDAARLRLFSAVAKLLTHLSRRAPVLLVVDDLQWASLPTLLLLGHLLREPRPGRLLVVGAFRDTEVDGDHALQELLHDLPRGVRQLTLSGLDEESVSALVAGNTPGGGVGGEELTRAVHESTGGNPFFVWELLRHLGESGTVLAVDELPDSVRATVLHRVARLGDRAAHILGAASVLGQRLSVPVLEDALGVEDDSVIDALDTAVGAGLLAEHGGRYRFRHDLVRQALFDELSAPRRARLHRRIAEALERQPAGTIPVEVLAHHFTEAAADAGPRRAAAYAVAAARQVIDGFAYEEAVDYAGRAVQLLDGASGEAIRDRAEALLLLADAYLRCGAFEEGRAAAMRAAGDARRLPSPELLAQAAVAYHGMHAVATVDAAFPALCEEALEAVGEEDTRWRPGLLARLAVYRSLNESDPERGLPLADEAVRLARSAGDVGTRMLALDALGLSLQGSIRTADRAAAAAELLRLAIRQGDVHWQIAGLYHRACVRLESGDRPGFDADVDRLGQLAETTRSFLGGCHVRAQRAVQAISDGDLDEGQERLNELLSFGVTNVNVRFVVGANVVVLHLHRGDLGKLRRLIGAAVDGLPPMPSFRLAFALALAEAGRIEQAQAEVEAVCSRDLATMARDHVWPLSISLLIEVCARTGDTARATAAYEALVAWSGKLIAPNGVICLGAADRYLGVAAATMGDHDRAARHFQDALDVDARAGVGAFTARNRLDWARALLASGRQADEEQAHLLLAEAAAQAEALGMAGVAADVAHLLGPGDAADETAAREEQDERRLVTALFADISGFSSLSEQFDDPEELHEIISPVISELAGIAEAYGGFIAKYVGDALLVFFGAPVAREDDAHRALQVALDMHEALPRLAAGLPAEASGLSLHVGVNTGRVISGQFGGGQQSDYSILGDAVILAQRFESVTPSGETYVGATTVEMVGDDFAFEPVGELRLKGKSAPVSAWRLVGRAERPTGGPGSAANELVGRQREQGRIRSVFDRIQEQNSGGVVAIVGEAGVGKSRLLADAREVARTRGVGWLQSRCLSYGSGVAYWPFAELVRSLAGLRSDHQPAEVAVRLRAIAGDRSVPFLATLVGAAPELGASTAPGFRRGLHDAIADLIARTAVDGPVALAIDDVHWADPSSLALTADLARRSLPLLFHLTARPEGTPFLDAVAEAVPGGTTLRLDLQPLDAEAVGELCASVLAGEPPDALISAVHVRTGGNPLFVQEVVRSLVDAGTLTLINGHWRLPAGFTPNALPTGIERVLTARIDLLPPFAAGVLRAAAVVGHQVLIPLLRSVAPDPDRVDEGVRILFDRGFLESAADGRADVVVFHNALMLDTAYGQLLRRHRRELHMRLADAAEQLYGVGDDVIDLLARHLYLAGAGHRAIDALARAGERARRLYATDEAVTHIVRAVEVARTEHDERLPDLVFDLAELRNLRGDYDEALALYEEAAGVSGRVVAVNGQADVLRKRGDYAAAMAMLDDALADAEAPDAALLWLQRSWTLSLMGRLADSTHAAEQGLAAVGDEAVGAQLRLQLTRNETLTGRLDAAAAHVEVARAYFGRVGDLASEARALRLLGDVHRAAGQLGEAADALRQGIDLAARSGAIEDLAGNLLNLGLVEVARGNLPEAIACDERAITEFERIDHGAGQAAGYGNLAEKLLAAGHLGDTEVQCERALAKGNAIGNSLIVADATRTLARLRLAQGRRVEAADLAADAGDRFTSMGMLDEAKVCAALITEPVASRS